MVSSLLKDSRNFLVFARNASRKGEDDLVLTYSRAVFFSTWSAMEGWINYIAFSFAETDSLLTMYEISFLKEKKIEIDDNGMIRVSNQDEYQSTLTKLLFLFQRFGGNFNLKSEEPNLWREIKEIEQIRHAIVHPKTRDEEISINLSDAERCYAIINKTIDLLKVRIYGK